MFIADHMSDLAWLYSLFSSWKAAQATQAHFELRSVLTRHTIIITLGQSETSVLEILVVFPDLKWDSNYHLSLIKMRHCHI